MEDPHKEKVNYQNNNNGINKNILIFIGKKFYKLGIVERKEIEKDVDLDIIECKNLIDIYKKSSQNAIK